MFLRILVALVGMLAWAGAFSTQQMALDLAALQKEGPRVAGSPAVNAAQNYIAAELRKVGYTVEFQPFSYSRTSDMGSNLMVGENRRLGSMLSGSPAGKVEGLLVAVPGVGKAEDYANLNVKGAIVLVQRGTLSFFEKVRIAAEQGAAGIVIYNNAGGVFRGTLRGTGAIPVLAVSQADGESLLRQAGSKASLEVRSITEEVQGRNVVAKRGTANPQAVVGAHLDSVLGAPGANDNGSGSVTILELARQLATHPLSERTWFIWFDGEEDGLWGSRKFVEKNPELVRGLKGMLNLDMVGVDALNGNLGLGGSSGLIGNANTVCSAAHVACGSAPDGGSDHVPFSDAGVPVAFFFRGLDPNYHQPGDVVADPALMAQAAEVAQGVLEQVLR